MYKIMYIKNNNLIIEDFDFFYQLKLKKKELSNVGMLSFAYLSNHPNLENKMKNRFNSIRYKELNFVQIMELMQEIEDNEKVLEL